MTEQDYKSMKANYKYLRTTHYEKLKNAPMPISRFDKKIVFIDEDGKLVICGRRMSAEEVKKACYAAFGTFANANDFVFLFRDCCQNGKYVIDADKLWAIMELVYKNKDEISNGQLIVAISGR